MRYPSIKYKFRSNQGNTYHYMDPYHRTKERNYKKYNNNQKIQNKH